MTEQSQPLQPQTTNIELLVTDSFWVRAEKLWSVSGASGKMPADLVKAIAIYMELDAKAVTEAIEPNPNSETVAQPDAAAVSE